MQSHSLLKHWTTNSEQSASISHNFPKFPVLDDRKKSIALSAGDNPFLNVRLREIRSFTEFAGCCIDFESLSELKEGSEALVSSPGTPGEDQREGSG